MLRTALRLMPGPSSRAICLALAPLDQRILE
jgi:hypothetical protein